MFRTLERCQRGGIRLQNMSIACYHGLVIHLGKTTMNERIAKHILTLGFSESDRQRMEHLTAENQKSKLSEAEKEELMHYVSLGHMLALIQSKACRYLKDNEDAQ